MLVTVTAAATMAIANPAETQIRKMPGSPSADAALGGAFATLAIGS
jgi:hypothetical protein